MGDAALITKTLRAESIAERGFDNDRNPLDTAGMDTDDEIWVYENPEWDDYIMEHYNSLLQQDYTTSSDDEYSDSSEREWEKEREKNIAESLAELDHFRAMQRLSLAKSFQELDDIEEKNLVESVVEHLAKEPIKGNILHKYRIENLTPREKREREVRLFAEDFERKLIRDVINRILYTDL